MKVSADRTASEFMLTMPGWVSVHILCKERDRGRTYHSLGLRAHSRHFRYYAKLRSSGRGAWRLRKQVASASTSDEKNSRLTFMSSRPPLRLVVPSSVIL
jgi:hypothetical protein